MAHYYPLPIVSLVAVILCLADYLHPGWVGVAVVFDLIVGLANQDK